MAARQSAMRPGGGARFAQFKLVLLGMLGCEVEAGRDER